MPTSVAPASSRFHASREARRADRRPRRRWTLLLGAVALVAGCGNAEHAAPTPPAYAPQCESAHGWDIAIEGDHYEALEGRRVWLAAVDRAQVQPRVVMLETRVKNGRFALSCAKGLTTSNQYPTWAVVVDADGDGRCSAPDVHASEQLYGWSFDVRKTIDRARMSPVSTAHTVVGDHDHFDFCALYFGP